MKSLAVYWLGGWQQLVLIFPQCPALRFVERIQNVSAVDQCSTGVHVDCYTQCFSNLFSSYTKLFGLSSVESDAAITAGGHRYGERNQSRVLASRWFVFAPALPREAIPFMVSGDRPFSCTRRALMSFRVCFQSCMGTHLGGAPCRFTGGDVNSIESTI